MAFEHEPETVWRAQELYCVDRLTFERVAQLTGVASSTLRRWADSYQWREKREEIAQAESDIRVNMIRARKSMLEKLLMAEDGKEASQAAFAVSSLEATALKQQELLASGKLAGAAISGTPTPGAVRAPDINNRAELAAALREAAQGKLSDLLSRRETVNLAAMRDVLACFELVAKVAPPEEATTTAGGALSAENMQAIRNLLGV